MQKGVAAANRTRGETTSVFHAAWYGNKFSDQLTSTGQWNGSPGQHQNPRLYLHGAAAIGDVAPRSAIHFGPQKGGMNVRPSELSEVSR